MASSAQQQDKLQVPNIIIIANESVLLYTMIGNYPEFETNRPLKYFAEVDKAQKIDVLKSIASNVVHIAIDPLFYDENFLKLAKEICVNIKRLTIDANLLELTEHLYKNKSNAKDGESMCRNLATFIAGFETIEELYFGPMLHLIEGIYEKRKWGLGSRSNAKVKFFMPRFSTDFINNLNPNLKVIFFGDVDIDSFDLRDAGSECPIIIKPMEMSKIHQLSLLEGGPVQTCLNKATHLKSVSINYFENCYHSDTVEELILRTLSGDNKVHEMFPNLKKIRVKICCPFIMDMSGTGNAGLYDGVVLDELEIEEQIPCFCDSARVIRSGDAMLQSMLHSAFIQGFNKLSGRRRASRKTDCHCVDVAKCEPLKSLKLIKLRCFDAIVARFILKLHEIGSQAKIIVYEKSRFERSPDHQSVWNNLSSLAATMNIVPHDKIEVVMKKVTELKMKKNKEKLSEFIPDDVKISFSE